MLLAPYIPHIRYLLYTPLCKQSTYTVLIGKSFSPYSMPGWLLEFYVLASSMVISWWILTFDNEHSWQFHSAVPLGNQVASTMTQYPTQSDYLGTDIYPPSNQTSSHYVLLNGLKLGANWAYILANFYELHGRAINFMDGLGWKGRSRTLNLLKIFWWPSHSERVRQHFKERSEN